jgi:hypothetical protein
MTRARLTLAALAFALALAGCPEQLPPAQRGVPPERIPPAEPVRPERSR